MYKSVTLLFVFHLFSLFFEDLMAQNHPFSWSGHNGAIRKIAVTSDNKRVITAGVDGTIKIWDKNSGKILNTIPAGGNTIYKMAVSGDDRYVAVHTIPGYVVYDLKTGESIIHKQLEGDVKALKFSPDSKSLFIACEKDTVIHLDFLQNKLVHNFECKGTISAMDISPDGKMMLVGHDSLLTFWDLNTQKKLKEFTGSEYQNINEGIYFFPKSSKFILGNYSTVFVKDFDGKTLRKITLDISETTIWSMKISPDERYLLASLADHYPHLWDLQTGTLIGNFSYGQWIWDVCFTPDGKQFAIVGNYPPYFKETATNKSIRYFEGIGGTITAIKQSPDYKDLIFFRDERRPAYSRATLTFRVNTSDFSVEKLRESEGYGNGENSNGDLLVFSGYVNSKFTHTVWSKSKKKLIKTLPPLPDEGTQKASVSPDGQLFLVECKERLYLCNLAGEVIKDVIIEGYKTDFNAAFSPLGKYIVYCHRYDGFPVLLDGHTMDTIAMQEESPEPIIQIAFSSDEKMLATCDINGTINIWDIGLKQPISSFQTNNKTISSICFSPDNTLILTNGTDLSARLWKASDGSLIKTITTPQAGDPGYTIDPEYRVWKWMTWAFFIPE